MPDAQISLATLTESSKSKSETSNPGSISFPIGKYILQGYLKSRGEPESKESPGISLEDLARIRKSGLLLGSLNDMLHGLNNCLTTIMGSIDLLDDSRSKAGSEKQIIGQIQEAGDRACNITRDIASYCNVDEYDPDDIDVDDLVRTAAESTLKGKRVKCQYLPGKAIENVYVDKGQVVKALVEILKNSSRAMEDNGTININTENLDIGPDDNLPLPEGKYVIMRLLDHGCGIKDDIVEMIFRPGFSTDKSASGRGLTLAQQNIIQNGGCIELKSSTDAGTAVLIYLPVKAESESRGISSSTKIVKGSGKILFMDDRQEVRSVMGSILERLGYKPDCAEDGTDAIGKYKQSLETGSPYDVVILDLNIPGGLGAEKTIVELKKIDPDVRALVCSGYHNSSIMTNHRHYGFRGFVTKPFTVRELSKALHGIVHEAAEDVSVVCE